MYMSVGNKMHAQAFIHVPSAQARGRGACEATRSDSVSQEERPPHVTNGEYKQLGSCGTIGLPSPMGGCRASWASEATYPQENTTQKVVCHARG